jgi:hypothetical protein
MESRSCKLFFELPIDKHLRCGQTRFAQDPSFELRPPLRGTCVAAQTLRARTLVSSSVYGDPGPPPPQTKTCLWGPRASTPTDEDLSVGTPVLHPHRRRPVCGDPGLG